MRLSAENTVFLYGTTFVVSGTSSNNCMGTMSDQQRNVEILYYVESDGYGPIPCCSIEHVLGCVEFCLRGGRKEIKVNKNPKNTGSNATNRPIEIGY